MNDKKSFHFLGLGRWCGREIAIRVHIHYHAFEGCCFLILFVETLFELLFLLLALLVSDLLFVKGAFGFCHRVLFGFRKCPNAQCLGGSKIQTAGTEHVCSLKQTYKDAVF